MVPPDGICALSGARGRTMTSTASAIATRTATRTKLRNASPQLTKRSDTAQALRDETFDELDDPQVNQVVPGGKHHERQHQRKPEPKPVFLRALSERPAADSLRRIKQQVTAVKNGDRKEIDEPEIDRQHRHEIEQRDDPSLRDLARHLRDAQRSADFVRWPQADDHLPYGLERAGAQVPGILRRIPQRGRGIALDIVDAAALDAQQADLVVVAESVGEVRDARRHVDRDVPVAPPQHHAHRRSGIEADDALYVLEAG